MSDKMLFLETLPPKTAQLANSFQQSKPFFLNDFYLSGGTALSLQLGHRESEDLDFFAQEPFNPEQLQSYLLDYGKLDQTELLPGTLDTFLNGVKLQFLEYPYSLLKPTVYWQNIRISSVIDIACTKLQTISSRGSKKDFIDLYFILDRYPLIDLFTASEKKYQNISYNEVHIMKSLVYFSDADDQPMPRMHQEVSWDKVKRKIIDAVKQVGI
jgi:predicted nucleotidyltransferase component of viral defense system